MHISVLLLGVIVTDRWRVSKTNDYDVRNGCHCAGAAGDWRGKEPLKR